MAINCKIMVFGYKMMVFHKNVLKLLFFPAIIYNNNKLQIGILRIIVKYPQ